MNLGEIAGKLFGKHSSQRNGLQGTGGNGHRLRADLLIKGPKIVAVGGGTGLSTMLRGLKAFTSNITAVVTVADDGGGSGVLRQELGMLPPGDIRNCILALADTEPLMEQLLQYRFRGGKLNGQNFGNLFLAAMDGISSSFVEAVKRMSDVLAVTGRVLPVTLNDVTLCAELEDGSIVCGESQIGNRRQFNRCRIRRVYLEPSDAEPLDDVIDAINQADVIVLGPGSLYTSILPNLLVRGICPAIKRSSAIKIYVCNVMTQPSETEEYNVSDHIRALEEHSCRGIIDLCIVSNSVVPDHIRQKYQDDGADQVMIDREVLEGMAIRLIEGDYASFRNDLVRHDSHRLAEVIIKAALEDMAAKKIQR